MICNTIEMLFIVNSNTFLKKMCFFPHEIFFTLIYDHFQLPNYCPFQPNFDGKFCPFFNCSLNFRAHALQLELRIPFCKISMTSIKLVKYQIFKKNYFPLKPTGRFFYFFCHWHDPKQKQNHQISTCRAKIRSTRSQRCVKYRGTIICIKRNPDVNKSDQKILHKKMSKKG